MCAGACSETRNSGGTTIAGAMPQEVVPHTRTRLSGRQLVLGIEPSNPGIFLGNVNVGLATAFSDRVRHSPGPTREFRPPT